MSSRKFSVPIRIKILTSLLMVVTFVVCIITYAMVGLFQKDKQTYVVDLTSFVAKSVASETDTILGNYRDQLMAFGRVLYSEDIPVEQKSGLVKSLFQDYEDFISITMINPDNSETSVYDAQILSETGITKIQIDNFRHKNPFDREILLKKGMTLRNSTFNEKLPSLTMAINYKPDPFAEPLHLVAVISLKTIMSIHGRSSVFENFLVDSRGTVLSHPDLKLVAERGTLSEFPIVKSYLTNPELTQSMEYDISERTFLGAFAQIKSGELASFAQIPKDVAFLTARELINNLLVIAFIILIVSAIASLFWSHRLTRPIDRLLGATQEIAKGRFNINLKVSSRDEIGKLAGSFNKMAYELKAREEALKNAQEALVHSEKMGAFGQLGAGIAHEVKNPLTGILGYAQLGLRKLRNGESPTIKHLEVIEKETRRCKTIIENLMKFARQEKTEFDLVDSNQVVEDTIAIVNHQLTINNVRIEKQVSPVPKIMGNANQLQQVLINLLINAQQAMPKEGGEVKVSTHLEDNGNIEIRVSDNGPGIPADVQDRIFEPFFTTKAAGKGTGLGLSVTYGIIKDHKGDIQIESTPGKGATFIINLPVPEDKGVESVPKEDHIFHQ